MVPVSPVTVKLSSLLVELKANADKVRAWYVVAFETEFDFVISEFFAASLDVTVFVAGKAP